MRFVVYLAYVPFFVLGLALAYPLEIVVVLATWFRHIRAIRLRRLAEAKYRNVAETFLAKHGSADARLIQEVLHEHKRAVVARLMIKRARELPELPRWVREF
jgi:hypothetical protein